MNNIHQQIYSVLKKSKSIGVISHINPDGDTVCSALALVIVLNKMGKVAELICDDILDPKLAVVPCIELFNKQSCKEYDTVISVDSSDITRLGNAARLLNRAKTTISIDHHKTHKKFTDILYLSSKSSTSEMVFDFLVDCYADKIDDTIAEILYTGIITDSGGFGNSSVTADTHKAASELLKYDFDSDKVYYHYIKELTYNTFNLKMIALSKTLFFEKKQIAIVVFSKEDFEATNTSIHNTSGLLYDIINIDTVKVAAAISEVGDKNYKISLRSKDIDAANIALTFGGGGHRKAAGFTHNGYIENVIDDILKVCIDNL